MNASVLPDPSSAALTIAVLAWVTAVLSWVLSRALARAALLPDRPNSRSSHTKVTPRAGGLAVFVAWTAAMAGAAFLSFVVGSASLSLLLALVALIPFLVGVADDYLSLSAPLKLVGQVVAAVVFVQVFGGVESLPLPLVGVVDVGVLGAPLAAFFIVAFMNVYNFMDGANGLVAATGNFGLCAIAIVAAFTGQFEWSLAALMLAVALAGFAPVNIVEGRLFLGDNGSQAVGFLIAALGLLTVSGSSDRVDILFPITCFSPLIFDVMFTLAHRAWRGRRLAQAHREHIYQLMIRLGRTHVSTTSAYLVATAVSSAVAFLMLAAPPALRFIAPLALLLVFLPMAIKVYRRAGGAALLEGAPSPPLGDLFDAEAAKSFQAAE